MQSVLSTFKDCMSTKSIISKYKNLKAFKGVGI